VDGGVSVDWNVQAQSTVMPSEELAPDKVE
jgi:hypothetical protein